MNSNWLAVASADHVRRAKNEGVMQVCHGKSAPLKRIKPDDCVIYYSPTITFRGHEKYHSFTAIGIALSDEPYQVDMGNAFHPFRLNMKWATAGEFSILPLLQELDLTKNKKNWGYPLRFGLIKISKHDTEIISQAMNALWL